MLTKKEKDQIFGRAVLTLARAGKKACDGKDRDLDQNMKNIVDSIKQGKVEIKNLLIEYLTTEQLAFLAADALTVEIGQTFKQCFEISMALKGDFDLEHFFKVVGKFCSERLGEDVQV